MNSSFPVRRWFLPLVGASLALAPSVHAALPVSIANAGFENPALAEATYPTTIPSWSQGRYETTNPGVWVAGTSGSGHYNVSGPTPLPWSPTSKVVAAPSPSRRTLASSG